MDRIQVFPGAIPLETDLLNTNKNTMVGLAKLCAAIFGTATLANGLSVVPTGPASLQVFVNPGEVYQLINLDGTAYSSLAADTTHQIVKQGILLDQATLSCPAPATGGFSINYLVQATYSDVDTLPVVLPYYNASNPAVAYSGPANAGTTNNTVRQGKVTLSAKAGTAAATGTQTTPASDAGYVGLYVVTVANAQTQITAPNIVQLAGAPILPSSLVAAAQNGLYGYALDTGTANVYQAAYSPAVLAITDGMVLRFKAKTANSGASTFSANGLAAQPIVGFVHQPLVGGEIVVNSYVWVQWNSSLSGWVLIDSTGGNQIAGRLLNVQRFTASGTYTPTPGTTSVIVEVQGGGGGGGGAGATTGTQVSGGSGGCGGTFGKSRLTSGFSGAAITIGAGGSGGTGAASGSAGGTSSFGALISAPGGNGGTFANPTAPPLVTSSPVNTAISTGANISNETGGVGAIAVLSNLTSSWSGNGGASKFGGGPQGVFNSSGVAASAFGSGGSGAVAGASSAALSGGAGASGIILIYEYA